MNFISAEWLRPIALKYLAQYLTADQVAVFVESTRA
jgi:hypothetical protein